MSTETIDRNVEDFLYAIAPFGSSDLRTAIDTAIQVGENGSWVAEQVQEFSESYEVKIADIDVVCCVYDSILQEARNEISDLIDFDFCNDGADIHTYGNYMATQYDFEEDAPSIIKEKLQDNNIVFVDLSVKTQWFLAEIEAEY